MHCRRNFFAGGFRPQHGGGQNARGSTWAPESSSAASFATTTAYLERWFLRPRRPGAGKPVSASPSASSPSTDTRNDTKTQIV